MPHPVILGFLLAVCGGTLGEIQQLSKPVVLGHGAGIEIALTKPSNQSVICAINPNSAKRLKSQFSYANLDSKLCTHILYNGGRINPTTKQLYFPDPAALQEVKAFKQAFPEIKSIISVGGWEEGVENFQAIAINASLTKIFVNSLKRNLNDGTFDAISIAWMWPGIVWRKGKPTDENDLMDILKQIRSELPNTEISLLLNGLVQYSQTNLDRIADYVDMMLILAQDYAGNWEGVTVTGHPAPLFGETSVNTIVSHVLQSVPPSKVILGIPFFGRTFLLQNDNPSTSGLGEPFAGSFDSTFDINQSQKEVGYSEICSIIQNENANVYFDTAAKAMFLKQGKKWVGFDGILSIQHKVKYVLRKELRGFLINTADTDDFAGEWCGHEKWPLLRGLVKALEDANGSGSQLVPKYLPDQDESNQVETENKNKQKQSQAGLGNISKCNGFFTLCILGIMQML